MATKAKSKSIPTPPQAATAPPQDQSGALFMSAFFFAQTGRCQCHACQCLAELAPTLLATMAQGALPGTPPPGAGVGSGDHP